MNTEKIRLAMLELMPDAKFNPKCFLVNEENARKLKLWRDERPMPSKKELEVALKSYEKKADIETGEIAEFKKNLKVLKKIKLENNANISEVIDSVNLIVKILKRNFK